jgi:type IV pilus assembly protein PilX
MKSLSKRICHKRGFANNQRGMVLFFALVALVVMSLAAVALIRSVDTSTMIAGNLAFRQSASTSSDSGVESAITWLSASEAAMKAANISVLMNPAHTFNVTAASVGYYSSANPALNLTDPAIWVNASSMLVGTDASGNESRFIIQRMCRVENQVASKTNCLLSAASLDNNGQSIPLRIFVPAPGVPKPASPRNTASRVEQQGPLTPSVTFRLLSIRRSP